MLPINYLYALEFLGWSASSNADCLILTVTSPFVINVAISGWFIDCKRKQSFVLWLAEFK